MTDFEQGLTHIKSNLEEIKTNKNDDNDKTTE